MTHATRHSSALPLSRPQAGQEACVRSPAVPLFLLLALLRLLALLARHHPALVARLGAALPLRRARSSWMHQSWGSAEDPDSIDAEAAIGLARAIARLLYVFGPRPRRGMRALPNTRPIPRRTPPIRPPPIPAVVPLSAQNPRFPGRFRMT